MVIVTELLPGMSLRKYLTSIRPQLLHLPLALSFALDIARALDCLHANGIIHRDLKPGMRLSLILEITGWRLVQKWKLIFLATQTTYCWPRTTNPWSLLILGLLGKKRWQRWWPLRQGHTAGWLLRFVTLYTSLTFAHIDGVLNLTSILHLVRSSTVQWRCVRERRSITTTK